MIIRVLALFLAFFISLPAVAQERSVPRGQGQVQLSFAPLVKKTAPAVVNIYTKRTVAQRSSFNPFSRDPFFAPFFRDDVFGGRMRKQIESALGSGVIVQADGLVVTNAHVIRGAEEITVVLADGREFEATLALADEASDLALLRVDKRDETLPFVTLKPSETLEVGDLVLAIGNPFGVGQTVTSGIVSAQGRSSLNINDFNFFIQTDAAINPGNSGGALVAMDGGVVGINTAIYSRDGGSLGIGFAIPSEMVMSVIAAEKAGANSASGIIRPWLGVSAQNVTADIGASLGLKTPQGALITALHSASPLKKAGVKVGDVVLSVNGKAIRDASEMKFRMATVPLGEKARVTLVRNEKELGFDVEAMGPPNDPPSQEIALKGAHLLNGAVIANLNPAVAVELGITGDEQGVVVMEAPRGSRAYRVLSPGDMILEINGRDIKGVGDVEEALAGRRQGLSLVLKSNGRVQRIVVR